MRRRPLRFPTSPQTASGAAFRSADWPANRSVLHIAADRIAVSDQDRVIEARIPELAGMYRFPDGGRHLVRRDGWTLQIEPKRWQSSGVITDALDATVPSHLHLPQPVRDAPMSRRTPWIVRWWTYLSSRSVLWPIGIVSLLMVIIYGVAIAIDQLPENVLGMSASAVQGGLLLAGVIAFLIARKLRTRPVKTDETDTGRTAGLVNNPGPDAEAAQTSSTESGVAPH